MVKANALPFEARLRWQSGHNTSPNGAFRSNLLFALWRVVNVLVIDVGVELDCLARIPGAQLRNTAHDKNARARTGFAVVADEVDRRARGR